VFLCGFVLSSSARAYQVVGIVEKGLRCYGQLLSRRILVGGTECHGPVILQDNTFLSVHYRHLANDVKLNKLSTVNYRHLANNIKLIK